MRLAPGPVNTLDIFGTSGSAHIEFGIKGCECLLGGAFNNS